MDPHISVKSKVFRLGFPSRATVSKHFCSIRIDLGSITSLLKNIENQSPCPSFFQEVHVNRTLNVLGSGLQHKARSR